MVMILSMIGWKIMFSHISFNHFLCKSEYRYQTAISWNLNCVWLLTFWVKNEFYLLFSTIRPSKNHSFSQKAIFRFSDFTSRIPILETTCAGDFTPPDLEFPFTYRVEKEERGTKKAGGSQFWQPFTDRRRTSLKKLSTFGKSQNWQSFSENRQL
jgi:hypothetical protein